MADIKQATYDGKAAILYSITKLNEMIDDMEKMSQASIISSMLTFFAAACFALS
jgi:hypothetical protein